MASWCRMDYVPEYVADCRDRVGHQLEAYGSLAKAVQACGGDASDALTTFEPLFFNDMVLVLDQLFTHRSRTIEGKDGNPLNEVRMVADAVVNHNDIFSPDKSIKYSPEAAVLKLQFGDLVRLSEADFTKLAEAFFAEIEIKYLCAE
jgi:hypothetical protein